MVNNYSKLFAEWATALQERYGSDLYFRTTLHVVLLQLGFVGALLFTLLLALWSKGDTIVYIVLLLVALSAGVLLARLTTRPVRDSLHNQKLFISNVAHELRTPLSTIKTSSEVALLDPTLDKDTRRAFVEIIEELNRVSEIINNLLSLNTLTRPERMQLQHLDYGALVDEVVRKLQPLARERQVRLTFKPTAGSIVHGNRTALEQVAHNIIKNALAFTPAKGTVMVKLYPKEERVLLEVADSGIGMTKEELLHIFEPFYRADTSRNRAVAHAGAGLGLTIVNDMVRMHRGTITIESHKRAGTTVVVSFPRGGLPAGRQGFIPASGGLAYTSLPLERGAHGGKNGRRT